MVFVYIPRLKSAVELFLTLMMSVEIIGEVQGPEQQDNPSVLDLTSLGKRNVAGKLKIAESKTLDNTIASLFYENALQFIHNFNVVDSPSFEAMVDLYIQFGQQNPRHENKALNQRRIGGPLLDSAYVASVQPIMDTEKK
jgi:hypothetical protein